MEVGGRHISNWIIARCAPGATLNLELEIRGKGFGVWAPRYRVMRRIHKKRSAEPVDVALLPGFVFVAAMDKLNMDFERHRGRFRNRFSWFMHDGVPLGSFRGHGEYGGRQRIVLLGRRFFQGV